MARTRIYVDSVIDKDHVRVLISTDGKTETPVIMEKKALEKLLKDKKDLWRKVKLKDKEERRLKRNIEGEAVTFPEADTPFFKQLVTRFRRPPRLTDERRVPPDERRVKRIKVRDIKTGLKKPTRSQKALFERQEALRKRRRVPR
ncbi:MAG: hypothetical protein ACXACD_14515 [Candidatus Thorarchaeota archaeon]|jgi:hypothetical protein